MKDGIFYILKHTGYPVSHLLYVSRYDILDKEDKFGTVNLSLFNCHLEVGV